MVRHAHAAPTVPTGRDVDRPVDATGHRQLARLASQLEARHRSEPRTLPDEVLTSPALRVRQTAQVLADAVGWPAAVVDRRLLHADGDDLVSVLSEVGADAGAVALVGHNPAMFQLVAVLVGPDRAPARYPTATAALLELHVRWPQIAAATASLVALVEA